MVEKWATQARNSAQFCAILRNSATDASPLGDAGARGRAILWASSDTAASSTKGAKRALASSRRMQYTRRSSRGRLSK